MTEDQHLEHLAFVEAVRTVDKILCIADQIYSVRERESAEGKWAGESWEGPKVQAYGNACEVIERYLREHP